MPDQIRIKSYKISAAGRGLKVTLPSIWLDDLGLKKGDRLDVYRDLSDRLIIVPAQRGAGVAQPGGDAA